MSDEPDLFSGLEPPSPRKTGSSAGSSSEPPRGPLPLAERMRPAHLGDYVGQAHLVGEGKLVASMMEDGRAHSLLLWGPPGTGKTTLARLLASAMSLPFAQLSAVLSGVKELRVILDRAATEKRATGRSTVVFIDEIHRFNKAQQDALLPHVEQGSVVLIGATTENPSFEVIAPLLSRMRVLTLEALADDAVATLIDRSLTDTERGLGELGIGITGAARDALVAHSQGDARIALGTLEVAAGLAQSANVDAIDLPHLDEAAQTKSLRYDRAGEEHYNVISAFIKSMRGSDADAALYYLVRMLEAGEDPLFIARRMVIFAAEDVGNADPRALQVALSVKDAVHFVGLPEGRIPLAQGVTYLASAAKSNASYKGLGRATDAVRETGTLPVPKHLRNAPTAFMKSQGYGDGYQYPHDHDGHFVDEAYLPDRLAGTRFYEPTQQGEEAEIAKRIRSRRRD